eukprot:SAG31_NODE_1785_length_7278_cov_4.205321_8_plen_46_part_00
MPRCVHVFIEQPLNVALLRHLSAELRAAVRIYQWRGDVSQRREKL